MDTDPKTDPAGDSDSDRSLLERFQRGQDDAATQLYLRYAERLHALTAAQVGPDLKTRLDPEDIVQSIFRTFFRRAAAGEYEVPEGEELWKLFLVIALNKVRSIGIHHHRAKRDSRQTTGGTAFEAAVSRRHGYDSNSLTILRMVIDDALAGLPKSQREVIALRIEGHEVNEIAERVGRARRSIERILQDFRQRLSERLREDD